ncbi:hypothetical protein D4S03_04080 [bacterium]|nr:MAG: hypothetical protein D4S03_04080 [bacterium]
MKTILLTIIFISAFIICYSQKRVALVIGNAAYQDAPLRNPVNDATDIAATLRGLGFTVTLKTNLNKRDMETAVRAFKSSLAFRDVALFYYSGHGMQVNGSNYLIPVGETILFETDVRYNAMEAQYVMDNMKDAGTSVNIIILDACRDNPFKGVRSQTKGFVAVSAPQGTFIAYSTAPETVALDGTGRNSPYTKNLIACIKKPGIEIEDAFKEVRRNVMNETANRQVPWESSSLIDDFSFSGSSTIKPDLSKTNTPIITGENPIVQYGNLDVTTEIGGTLYVDGSNIKQVAANTVFILEDLTQGEHTIKISGDETVERKIMISANHTAFLTIDKIRKDVSGKPCPDIPTFTDPRDGQVYPTVQIGSQCWMQKNMNYETRDSWCYKNKQSNCQIYGRLYDWQTALHICPRGWHLPSDAEWQKLSDYLGGKSVAGGKMKSTSDWYKNGNGSNSSGFTALPGGYRYLYGYFYTLTYAADFWSSTEGSSTLAWGRYLGYDHENVYRYYGQGSRFFGPLCPGLSAPRCTAKDRRVISG